MSQHVTEVFEKFPFLDSFIVQGSNCYLMEHIEPEEHPVAKFCKYRGSNGTLVVHKSKKVLITDSRYEVQNCAETYGVDEVIITGSKYKKTVDALIDIISEDKNIGIYGDIFSYSFLKTLIKELKNKKADTKIRFTTNKEEASEEYAGTTIFVITEPFIDQTKIEEKLEGFSKSVHQLPVRLAGVSHLTKLISLISQIVVPNKNECDKFIYVANKCEFVSWILNLRGRGSSISQICRGIMLIYAEKVDVKSDEEFTIDAHVMLFASKNQFEEKTLENLHISKDEYVTCLKSEPFYNKGEAGDDLRKIKCRLTIDVEESKETMSMLHKISEKCKNKEKEQKTCMVVDVDNTTASIVTSLTGGHLLKKNKDVKIVSSIPIYTWICDKHPFEIESMRKGLLKESTAFTTFIHKAKKIQPKSCEALYFERELEDLLYAEQIKQGAISKSFNSIVGINQHSAVIHYEAHGEANESIYADGLHTDKEGYDVILVDAGAQYENSLTDTTRTFVRVCDAENAKIPIDLKLAYTAVLKGHIAAARAVVTKDTPLYVIDSLVRSAMISARGGPYNYGHSTGHGVGCGLDVHEGDFRMFWRAMPSSSKVLKPGFLITDEPGCYYLGKWGIRLENILLCKESLTHPDCIEFEPLTYIPFDKSLILIEELSSEELDWLRNYNKKVVDHLSSRLEAPALSWLMEEVDY